MTLVLVVDDEPLVRMGAVDLFEEAGYQTIEAGSADEAVKLLEVPNKIVIVFSDLMMPGAMNGLRLLQLIRLRWPSRRLILTSGKPLPANAELPTGVVFLLKPYSLADISAACEAAA